MRFYPLLLLGILLSTSLPSPSLANTLQTDWTLSSSLDTNPDKAGTTSINLRECKDEVANNYAYTFTFKLRAAALPSTSARYSIKLATNNQTCDESSLDDVAEDTCTLIVDNKTLSTSATITEEFDFSELTDITDPAACDGTTSTTYIYLIVSDIPTGTVTASVYNVPHKIEFNTTRPSVPTDLTLTAGESTIDASWSETDGADHYTLYYSTEAFSLETPPEDQPSSVQTVSTTSGTDAKISGLSVNTTYYVAVVAVDEDDNESFFSNQETIETVPVIDFWEAYSQENQDVQGGFCFIATAAYGSYQEPHVQVLRQFRDEFLMTHAPGRLFVDVYYTISPPIASLIADHPWLRAATRIALWPLYALAVLLVYGTLWTNLLLLSAFVASVWLARRAWKRMNHSHTKEQISNITTSTQFLKTAARTTAALGILCLGFGVLKSANAQYLPQGDSPVSVMLELKGGAYAPTELGDSFNTYFPDASPIMLEIEYDWQFYRGIGSAAIGGSLGYASVDGSGRTQDGTASADSTSLSWLPLRLQLVYRFDWVAIHWNVPLVPYGKIGLDYYFWWVTNGEDETATNDAGQEGSGGTFGWHAVGGLAFLLDWLAPGMAKTFDMEWGVNNSYLFAEYMYVQADGLWSSGKLNLSSDVFMFGLALEF